MGHRQSPFLPAVSGAGRGAGHAEAGAGCQQTGAAGPPGHPGVQHAGESPWVAPTSPTTTSRRAARARGKSARCPSAWVRLPLRALRTVGLITSSPSSSSPHLDGFSDRTRGFNASGYKSVWSNGLQQQGSLNKIPARAGSGRVALPAVKPRQGACHSHRKPSRGLAGVPEGLLCLRSCGGQRGFPGSLLKAEAGRKMELPSPRGGQTRCSGTGMGQSQLQGRQPAPFICSSIRIIKVNFR